MQVLTNRPVTHEPFRAASAQLSNEDGLPENSPNSPKPEAITQKKKNKQTYGEQTRPKVAAARRGSTQKRGRDEPAESEVGPAKKTGQDRAQRYADNADHHT